MEKDLVSVILTSYNSNEKFIVEAIQSVFNQTYKNIEFILIDDGSTNNTINKISQYIDFSKIKLIKQKNLGLCGARNTGIKNSNGKYVAFIDDDDIWLEDKIEKCVKCFYDYDKKYDNLGLVFSQSKIIDENDEEKGVYGFIVRGNIYKKILGKNIIGPPSSVVIKKDVLYDIGLFNNKFIYAEDIELWYRLTQKYSVVSINEPLIKYRYRAESLSKNFRQMGVYTEKALITNINKNITEKEKRKILAKYYYDYANLYFSASDKEFYIKYLRKANYYDDSRLISFKHLFGRIVCLFGENTMKKFNKIRRFKQQIPPSY